MKLDNDFNLRAGDDIVFGGFGGDSARLGAGNDIFIGGENGEFDKWGWQRKDEARFENSHIRYDIESSIWKGSADTYEVHVPKVNLYSWSIRKEKFTDLTLI